MSLNTVVNKLMRAAASVPLDVSDDVLDAHVAKILAEEAKLNELKWAEMGLGAYVEREAERSSPDPNAPKPNKRFLASMIKSVDGHNKALLREQAKSARDARAGGSSSSGINRLFGGAIRGAAKDAERASRRDRDCDRERDTRRDRSRRSDGDDDRRSRRREEERYSERRRDRSRERSRDRSDRHRSRSRSRERERARDRRDRREGDRSRDRDRRDERERDRRSEKEERRKRDPSPDRERRRDRRDRDRDSGRDRSHSPGRRRDRSRDRRDRDRSPKRRSEEDKDKSFYERGRRPLPPTVSPPPPPPESPPAAPSVPISRMDKYFKQDYDPRLDVGAVPKEGIVADVGWDNMLAVLKERGHKRRRHSPGLSSSPEPERKSRHDAESRRSGRIGPSLPDEDKQRKGLLDVEYTRQGGMRAWDVGKEL